MADNVPVSPGSGEIIGADERTINSVAVKVQRVVAQGSTAFAPDQYAPTSTATSATIAARETRQRIILINAHASIDLYVSDRATNAGTPATTTSKSAKIVPGASLTLYTTAAVYVFTASGTGALHAIEEYDS